MESRPDAMFACRTPGCYPNIATVNVPALLVTLPPWLVLAAGLRGRSD